MTVLSRIFRKMCWKNGKNSFSSLYDSTESITERIFDETNQNNVPEPLFVEMISIAEVQLAVKKAKQ